MGDINTTKPRVVHVKKSDYDVYIGRAFAGFEASKWANPYTIGKDGTRQEVIAKYETYLKRTPELMKALPELENKVLACWCKGTNGTEDVPCHGDVLIRLLEDEKVKQKLESVAPSASVQEVKQEVAISEPKQLAPPMALFTTHYSLGDSILTLEEAGKTKQGNPVSICDIAKENKLSHVIIVDERIDGYIEAYKNIQKAGIAQLVYGLKLVVCDDMTDKNEVTKRNESKVIIFLKNTQGYNDVIRIWNRAWTDGYFTSRDEGYGRIDWKTLKTFWTPNLILALPFFSSFIARNTLTMASIVPDLPVPVSDIQIFREIDSNLPFSPLIDRAIDQFVASNPDAQIQPVKSIYYHGPQDYETYVTFRAIHNRAEFMRPEVDHLYSDRFSFKAWKELVS